MYLFLKATHFAEAVLKIEGDEISAVEVAHHLEVLKGNISVRKRENYMDPATEEELSLLTEEYEESIFFDNFDKFYG